MKKAKAIKCLKEDSLDRFDEIRSKMYHPQLFHFNVENWNSCLGLGQDNERGLSDLLSDYLSLTGMYVGTDFSITSYYDSDLASDDILLILSDEDSFGLVGIYPDHCELLEDLERIIGDTFLCQSPVPEVKDSSISPMQFKSL